MDNNEALWDVIRACERYGIVPTDAQMSAWVARVEAGESAARVVGSLTIDEVR